MCRLVVLFSYLYLEHTVLTATFDQRQNGDLNVQIDLKNLKIVGLMKGKEEYVDYDYAYDYSEMTIKPSSGTTKKPLNTTESPSSDKDKTTATTVFTELDQTTTSIPIITESSIDITTQKIDIHESYSTMPSSTIITTSSSPCKKGFFRNNKGRCELKLQNPSNALLKMIRQKLKINNTTRT